MKLNEIFDIEYGVDLELINCEKVNNKSTEYINFVSRTSENNGVSARVKPIKGITPQPAGTISCAAGGSVLSTFLQPRPYYSGRDLFVLTPKYQMSDSEKLFWCTAISSNAYKYSYGRQANTTLGEIELPDEVPEYILNKKIIAPSSNIKLTNKNIFTQLDSYKTFELNEIFDSFEPTKGETVADLIEGDDIPYIAAKKKENGFDKMVSKEGNEDYISKGNCIVFVQLGAGSAGYSTYQPNEFIGMKGKTSCGYHTKLNKYNALFLITILDQERPKFSFGRSWTGNRLTNTKIKLPSIKDKNGNYYPDWDFMEDFIKQFPNSDLI
ncbi:restriction endonuclease subunit S [Ruoffia sp. FAM 20857]|uniref:restriction endonuclease subunit S n=1 Tax=Ruoffia sp. FAM 20857 TaxID=3259515 RepID=UPI003883F4A9